MKRMLLALTITIPYAEMKSSIDHLTELLQTAKATAQTKNGKVTGYKISQIKKGGLFDHMKLKNVDVITKVDGQSAYDPAVLLQNVMQIERHEKKTFDLEFTRVGKTTKAHYIVK
ncbi:MAG: hypothetical protein JST80_04870 [Bdellovibrionales bacterium]|nr:hypothetical protein [Bdellovibrionales bacterium]